MLGGLCRGVRRDELAAPGALGASALDPACCSKPRLANLEDLPILRTNEDFPHVASDGSSTAAEASAP